MKVRISNTGVYLIRHMFGYSPAVSGNRLGNMLKIFKCKDCGYKW